MRASRWCLVVMGTCAIGLLNACAAESGDEGVVEELDVESTASALVAAPKPSGTDITDQAAAIRLGKALFWDAQAGSDGQTACATCHFHAGADNRKLNTLSPGPDGIFGSGGVNAPAR